MINYVYVELNLRQKKPLGAGRYDLNTPTLLVCAQSCPFYHLLFQQPSMPEKYQFGSIEASSFFFSLLDFMGEEFVLPLYSKSGVFVPKSRYGVTRYFKCIFWDNLR